MRSFGKSSLFRSNRASIAILTAILASVLLGFVALGGEASSWYLTRQHAQNAADAAALSGVFDVINGNSNLSNGTYLATLNGFTDRAIPYSGSVQAVSLTRGYYDGTNFTTTGTTFNAVKAVITQTAPASFSSVFGLGTTKITASSIAEALASGNACILSLGNMSIGGSTTVNGTGCYLMANGQAQFNGSSATINVTGYNAAQGCTSANGQCLSTSFIHNWYTPPVTNPLASLSTFNVDSSLGNKTANNSNTLNLAPYESNGNKGYGDIKVTGGGILNLSPGTYFFSTLTMTGGIMSCPTCTSSNGVNIVIQGTSGAVSIGGGATIQLMANTSNTTFPSLNGVLLYDRESDSVTINGSSNSYYGGVIYFPYANLTWEGNANSSMNCTEIIGGTVSISGSTASNFNTSGCPSSIIPKVSVAVSVK